MAITLFHKYFTILNIDHKQDDLAINVEAVFGQMKYDMGYKRFRHFGLDKVRMDFAFFAIAFNLKKMCSKMAKTAKNGGNPPTFCRFIVFYKIQPSAENRFFCETPNLTAA